MNYKKGIVIFILMCLLGTRGFGHALWIQSKAKGVPGVPQEVKVYFGEYGNQEFTEPDKWFSDLKEFSLVLITPEHKEIKLKATPQKDHFVALFTPESEGVYTLVLQHTASEPYYGYKLDYHSLARVQVGLATGAPGYQGSSLGMLPDLKQAGVGDTVHFSRWVAPAITGDQEIEVMAPNGWLQKLYANKEGKAGFVPLWPGKYLLEMIVKEEKKGLHNGKEYKVDFHCATYMLEVE